MSQHGNFHIRHNMPVKKGSIVREIPLGRVRLGQDRARKNNGGDQSYPSGHGKSRRAVTEHRALNARPSKESRVSLRDRQRTNVTGSSLSQRTVPISGEVDL